MKIAVMGAGALGSLVGGLLAKENDVTLIGRREHMSAIAKDGLRIEGLNELTVHPSTAMDVNECKIPELLILAVKSYDTESAMAEAKHLVGDETAVLSLQNGLGNIKKIAGFVSQDKIIGGITSHGATYIREGHIRHAGHGETVIGSVSGNSDVIVIKVADILTKAGLETQVTGNIEGEIWAKAIVNAAINPLTAILRTPNGFLLESESLKQVMKQIVDEGVGVADAVGVRLPDCDIFEKALGVAERTAANKSSMLQDIERGKRTEIDAINGALAEIGKSKGLDVSVNRTLEILVKALERN